MKFGGDIGDGITFVQKVTGAGHLVTLLKTERRLPGALAENAREVGPADSQIGRQAIDGGALVEGVPDRLLGLAKKGFGASYPARWIRGDFAKQGLRKKRGEAGCADGGIASKGEKVIPETFQTLRVTGVKNSRKGKFQLPAERRHPIARTDTNQQVGPALGIALMIAGRSVAGHQNPAGGHPIGA